MTLSPSICLKIRGRADVGPIDVGAAAQLGEGFSHGRCKGLKGAWKVRRINKLQGMGLIRVKASSTAYNKETDLRTTQGIAEMLQG